MKGWKEQTLGNLCHKVIDNRGKTPPLTNSGYELLEVNAVSGINKFPDYSKVSKFVSRETYHNWFRSGHPNAKDILIPTVGTIGNVSIFKENRGCIAQNLIALNIKDNVSSDYIYYFLSSPLGKDILWSLDIGGVQPSIKVPHLLGLTLLLPPTPEQQAIAAVLSSLDDKIDLLHRQNATLEAMAEALFRQWFVANEKSKYFCLVTEWISFNPKRSIANGDIAKYLEMSNVNTKTFHPSDFVSKEFSSGMKFTNGDTLLARITPCLENGKTCYVTFLENGKTGWGSTEYIVMRPHDVLHPFFAYCLAKTDDFRGYAENCLNGSSGRQRVDAEHLKQYEIVSPTEQSIEAFNNLAVSVVPKLHNNFIQIRTLEKLRDTLLPKLMSGEVRVSY